MQDLLQRNVGQESKWGFDEAKLLSWWQLVKVHYFIFYLSEVVCSKKILQKLRKKPPAIDFLTHKDL